MGNSEPLKSQTPTAIDTSLPFHEGFSLDKHIRIIMPRGQLTAYGKLNPVHHLLL